MPWPDLPAEGLLTEVEQSFIENSPSDLWPDNQDSNFGQIRRVTTDPLQECIDFISTLYFEMFVATSTRYLNLWEELVNVPTDPPLSLEARRAIVGTILRKGPFTRRRRNDIINAYVIVGIGSPISLVPEGVPIPEEGIPIFDEYDPTSPPFFVVETVEEFYYSVRIRNGTAIDDVAVATALTYFQPSGLHYTLDYVVSPTTPQTSYRDDFNRADENPLATSGARGVWGGAIFNAGNRLKIVGAKCQAAAADGTAFWPTVFQANQEAWLKFSSNTEAKLFLRLTDEGTATVDGYYVVLKGGASTEVDFYKIVNGTPSLISTETVGGYASNDEWVFRAVGNALKVYRNGLIEASIIDSSITGGGKIGMGITNTGVNVSRFGGGDVTVT